MKGLQRSLSRGSPARQDVVKQVVKVNKLAIQVDGATGVGFGSAVIGGLPEGNILFLGAVAYMQFTKAASATGIQATFDGDYGIGTTPASDATITDTDVDIIASTALGAATAGVSPRARGTNATQAIFDNTDGSLELNLNLLIDDANISADDQDLTVSGELYIVYSVLGDD
ncbi:hypothetical protein [Pseudomonas phage pPA-3099-2aT.3]|nr:hypothetical protein [Pseudomonas phage pPA-3099-2aT.3]